MKTAIVPAQVTTVEDTITGNLTLSQLLLLVVPIFAGSGLFVVLPPFFGNAPYKIVLIVCLAAICGVLAIRIKGKVLLFWAIAMVRYNTRPRYYVFDKNDAYLRETEQPGKATETAETTEPTRIAAAPLPQLSTAAIVQVESLIANPAAKLHFKANRKGELRVIFTEVK